MNRDDGEIIGECDRDRTGTLLFIPYSESFGKDYTVAFFDLWQRLAYEGLPPSQMRIFAYIMLRLDYEGKASFTQKEVCRDLHMHKGDVSKNLTALIEKGYITRKDNIHYLSLELGWRGKAKDYNRAVKVAGA